MGGGKSLLNNRHIDTYTSPSQIRSDLSELSPILDICEALSIILGGADGSTRESEGIRLLYNTSGTVCPADIKTMTGTDMNLIDILASTVNRIQITVIPSNSSASIEVCIYRAVYRYTDTKLSSWHKIPYIYNKTVTGTTDANGTITLGLDPKVYKVLSCYCSNTNIPCFPYTNANSHWLAFLFNWGFTKYASKSVTVNVTYIKI